MLPSSSHHAGYIEYIVCMYQCAHIPPKRALKIWCENVSLCPHTNEMSIENLMWKSMHHCAHIPLNWAVKIWCENILLCTGLSTENLMWNIVIVPTYHWTQHWKIWCKNVFLCPHTIELSIENLMWKHIVPTYHWTKHWNSDVKTCHCAHVSQTHIPLCSTWKTLHALVSNMKSKYHWANVLAVFSNQAISIIRPSVSLKTSVRIKFGVSYMVVSEYVA